MVEGAGEELFADLGLSAAWRLVVPSGRRTMSALPESVMVPISSEARERAGGQAQQPGRAP